MRRRTVDTRRVKKDATALTRRMMDSTMNPNREARIVADPTLGQECLVWANRSIQSQCTAMRHSSKPRINRLTFERQHAEDALMHSPQRLFFHEPLEGFHPEGELA